MERDLVSVIITTYNRPRYLEQTLKSVIDQIYKKIEIIVVDDGSPGEENERICNQWTNIKYLKIANTGGPIIPRNIGFHESRGEYVAFLDDDDMWMPNKIYDQVNILKENPEFGLVHGCCFVIDQNGDRNGKIVGRLRNPNDKHGNVFDRMVGNFTVMMPTPLMRRGLVDKVGGFNEDIPAAGEDMEFFCKLAFYTPFYYQNDPMSYYRVHQGNISDNNVHYRNLPLVLYKMVGGLRRDGLSRKRFDVIKKRLLLMQLELIKSKQDVIPVLNNCIKISPCFFVMPHVIKSVLKRIVTTY